MGEIPQKRTGELSILDLRIKLPQILDPSRRLSYQVTSNKFNFQQQIWSVSIPARLCAFVGVEDDSFKNEKFLSTKKKPGWERYVGIILTLLASICFSLSVIVVKSLVEYDPLNVAVYRFGGVSAPLLAVILYYECQPSKGVRVFEAIWPPTERAKLIQLSRLVACGVFGSAGKILQLYSLNYIDVADASAISYSSPVCVVILAHFFLREKCGVVSILVAITTGLGVFVISRPPIFTGAASFDMNTLIGTALALSSMLGSASSYILMRGLREAHFALLILTFTFWGTLESLIASVVTGVLKLPHGLQDSILMMLVIPTLVFLGQVTLTFALKFEDAGPVALVRTTDVLFSFCWQYIFLGVIPDVFSVVGATIVVSGVLVTGARKMLLALPPENLHRRRLCFLLK